MTKGKWAYWRYKSDKTWNMSHIHELLNGLVEAYSASYYSDKPIILSADEIEIKWVAEGKGEAGA